MAGRRLSVAALLALLAAPALVAALHDKGIIYLDDLTFDKLVNGREDVLVRFDKEYPWGDAHDMFKELALNLGENDVPLLIAGVGISNREEYLVNPRLSRRYGLDKLKDDDFPKFRLFRKGADTKAPLVYDGKPKKDDIITWLTDHVNIFIGKKGQVEALDAAAKKLLAAKPADRPAALREAQAAAIKLELGPSQKDYVEYYIKTMERVIEKGEAYVKKESERLKKMAEDKSVAAAKREVFEWKVNVLGSFLPKEEAQKDDKKKDEL